VAISAIAKNALISIKTNKKIICNKYEPSGSGSGILALHSFNNLRQSIYSFPRNRQGENHHTIYRRNCPRRNPKLLQTRGGTIPIPVEITTPAHSNKKTIPTKKLDILNYSMI
jgi:hypothetical protein